jgi:hypothetical protein
MYPPQSSSDRRLTRAPFLLRVSCSTGYRSSFLLRVVSSSSQRVHTISSINEKSRTNPAAGDLKGSYHMLLTHTYALSEEQPEMLSLPRGESAVRGSRLKVAGCADYLHRSSTLLVAYEWHGA